MAALTDAVSAELPAASAEVLPKLLIAIGAQARTEPVHIQMPTFEQVMCENVQQSA